MKLACHHKISGRVDSRPPCNHLNDVDDLACRQSEVQLTFVAMIAIRHLSSRARTYWGEIVSLSFKLVLLPC